MSLPNPRGLAMMESGEADIPRGVNQVVSSVSVDLDNVLNNAGALYATSLTSRTIGTGTKVFTTVEARDFLLALPFVLLSSASDQSKWMLGKAVSYEYATKTLTVDVQQTSGTGTVANWKIALSGPPSNLYYSATKRWQWVFDDTGAATAQEV